MDAVIRFAPVAGCLVMGVMMWLMMRGRHGSGGRQFENPNTEEEINRLRAEVELLKREREAGRSPE